MDRFRHPLTCAVAGTLVVAGAALAGPFAVGTVAGGLLVAVGSETVADLAGRGWAEGCDRVFNRNARLNHDLQAAFRRAFVAGTKQLEHSWFEEHPLGKRQRGMGPDSPARVLFGHLRSSADRILTEDWLDELAEDPDALGRFRAGGDEALGALQGALATLLQGHDPQLVEFLQNNLAAQMKTCFEEELKRDDREGTKAHRAFEFLVFDRLLANGDAVRAELGRVGGDVQRLLVVWEEAATRMGTERDAMAARIAEEVVTALGERLRGPGTAKPVNESRSGSEAGRPRIWDVPHRWNPYFVGRRDLLDRLAVAFTAGGGPAVLVQAIQGLGGVGKTQLAVSFAYERAGDYDGVWWLRAQTPTSLAADYARLARRLGLPEAGNPEQAVVTAAVIDHLEGTAETGKRWLLVFDNAVPRFAEDGEDALAPYLPRRGRCDVLITSRARDWSHVAEPLDVDVLPLDDAVLFLKKRSGQHDEQGAQELAQELGRLPLALEQAGAYVADKRGLVTLADYLALFRRQPLDRLQLDRARTGEYGERAATTWLISFTEVEQRSAAAADLLELCAFLAPEAIPLDDIVVHASVLPEPLASALRDPADAVEAVDLLLRFSLAGAGEGRTLNVHRLVQLVARSWLTMPERERCAAAAVSVVNEAFPNKPSEPYAWLACARLLTHALAATAHAEELDAAAAATDRLLNQAGLYLRQRAQFAEAQDTLQRALAIAERVYGPDHPHVATGLNNLAGVLQDQGDLAGAKERFERALAIRQAALPPDHPDIAQGLNNLAGVLQDQGDLNQARALFERALAIRRERGDEEGTLRLLHALATIELDLGNPAGAA